MDLISVIIPAHNEEKYIIPTLKSVLESSDQNFEIIVVVNGCTDKTRAQTESVHNTKIRSYIIPEASVSKARNYGALHSKGNILVFLDADTHPSKNAITLIRQNTDNTTIGTLKIYPDSKKLFGRILFFLKNIFLKYFLIYPTSNGIIFTTKKVFNEIGGFNEALKKREDGALIRIARKTKKFKILTKAYVITSMRRYEKKGYLGTAWFWLKDWFLWVIGKSKQEYEVVR